MRLRKISSADADGNTFEDLYGYADTPTAEVVWLQGVGAWDSGDAAAAFGVACKAKELYGSGKTVSW